MSLAASSGDSSVSDFEPETQCPNRVFVNGTRVPVSDVDVHLRKEGPLAINRYAEVNFASPWAGEDYLSLFDTLKDVSDQNGFDILRIESRNKALDSQTDGYSTLFTGFITGVGGTSKYDNQAIHQCRAQGFEHLLESIPASERYESPYQAITVLDDIRSLADEKTPDDVTISNGYSDLDLSLSEQFLVDNGGNTGVDVFFSMMTNKTFTANKHTLTDLIDWFQEKSNLKLWIQPTENGGSLVVADNPTQQSQHHTAHYLDGGTQIISNSALSEIKPLNQITLNSSAKKTIAEPLGFEVNIPDDSFTQVTARHTPLYQRSGGIELSDTITKSDAESAEEAEREAKQRLKERIDGATSGSMQVIQNRVIQPFDTIEARPTVNEVSDDQINSLTYEVSRCHYKAHHNDDTMPHIDIQCGLKTDVEEDIEIIRTNEKDA